MTIIGPTHMTVMRWQSGCHSCISRCKLLGGMDTFSSKPSCFSLETCLPLEESSPSHRVFSKERNVVVDVLHSNRLNPSRLCRVEILYSMHSWSVYGFGKSRWYTPER